VEVKRVKISILLLLGVIMTLWSQDGNAIDLYHKGEKSLRLQNYYEAIDNLQEALRINPSYLDAILSLADAYFRIEEYEEAYGYIEMASLYGRNDIVLINMKARILIGREDLKGAEELFLSVLSREPNNLDANLGLAEIALLRGDREKGVEHYTKSLVLSPESRRALLSLALLYDIDGFYDEGEYYLELALSYHSRDPEVFISLAKHYLLTGDLEKAEYFARNGTQIAPGIIGPFKLLGQSFMEQEKWLKAIDPLIQALSKKPKDVSLLYMLSQCYINLSMTDAALKTLDKALRLDPFDEIIRITMEQFLINNPGTDIAMRNDLGNYHFEKGVILEKNFYYNQAFNEYRRARWINPYDWEGWINYGRIFNKQGFPGKYLNTMQAIKQSGYDQDSFLETLMILEHKKESDLADKWKIDQFDVEGNPYNIIFFPKYARSFVHIGAEGILGDYLKFILLRYSLLNPDLGQNIQSFSEAFSMARQKETDYFVVLDFSETDRTFLCTATLFLSGTGAKIGETTVMRTGKGRVALAMEKLAENLNNFFLPRAVLLDLDGDKALVGRGRYQGLEEEQEALLIKRNSVSLLSQKPWIEYKDEDLLGKITITDLDEEISQGIIERNALFDLINPGDELYFIPLDDGSDQENKDALSNDLIPQQEKRIINNELKSQLLRLN
jgi:tetratricopeptide (TPR) repeat protein